MQVARHTRLEGHYKVWATIVFGTVNLKMFFNCTSADHRLYGIATIRSDLAAPRIKRISDTKNYGDESDAFGLMNPSMYSNRGVYEKDFFQARPQNQVKYSCL